ncbi:MAG: hypothetical protein LBU19_03445 [Treponema sp.]|jgi:hypothetical protein|nr:hypothetical protein [Treponema sp.]
MKKTDQAGPGGFYNTTATGGSPKAAGPALFPVFFFLFLFALFSCSRAEPVIEFGFLELVYYQGEGGPEERFNFFVIPQDDDGIENLEELRLFHDYEGLSWTLTSDDWIRYDEENRSWIGSRSIAMAGGGTLPRGLYRAVLANKGGEKSERSFAFDAPAGGRFPFPSLEIREGWYRVESRYPENKFICYDSQGASLQVILLTELSGPLSSLDIPSDARSVALWAEDREYSTSALGSMVPLRQDR